ncbi:MAG TPA: RIP metalloprotease RseP [Terracidiphilus sp.]|nr:RIP metalloprotease RseP [Terracidiphilus sp.]
MHDFFISAVAFIVLVGVMVVVHEFGHFLVAKLCGVRVEAFSVGFGPRLFGIKYGDTDYKVCLLPLGGFVKMTGENPGEVVTLPAPSGNYKVQKTLGYEEESQSSEESLSYDPGSFMAHPRWQRMLIGVAGPFFNFLLAFGLMCVYFNFINEVPDIRTTKLEWVTPGSAADQAGLKPGDAIAAFDNVAHPDYQKFHDLVGDDANKTVPVTVDRNGATFRTSIHLPGRIDALHDDLSKAGIFVQYTQSPIQIDQVSPGSPAQQVGLVSGDKIVAVDGHEFHTVLPLVDYMQTGKGKPITLTIERRDVTLAPIVVHPYTQDGGWRLGFLPAGPENVPVRAEPMDFASAIGESRDFCAENSLLIVNVLKKLLTHQVSVKQLSGPVGIAVAAGQAVKEPYWSAKFGLAASISLNLGILNLLPFPILDGGLILLLMIESIMRRDISMIVKERIYQAAFVVLVAFFAFIMFNDVSKLQIFSHLKP